MGVKTKERILLQARRLFSKNGFYATKVEDISRAAKVNKATIYYYFDDKRSLYEEVIYRELSVVAPKVVQLASTDTSLESFVNSLIDVYFDFLFSDVSTFKLLLREICDGGVYLKRALLRLKEEYAFFKMGGVARRLEEMGVRERCGLEGLDFWIGVMGLVTIHFLSEPFVEVIYGRKVDKGYLNEKKEIVKEIVGKILRCGG